jgi:hypothetical protein
LSHNDPPDYLLKPKVIVAANQYQKGVPLSTVIGRNMER